MTKLEAINKILTEKLAGTKQGKTLLEALNYVNQTYGGTGDADTMADALEQLYAVFSKGSEGDVHFTWAEPSENMYILSALDLVESMDFSDIDFSSVRNNSKLANFPYKSDYTNFRSLKKVTIKNNKTTSVLTVADDMFKNMPNLEEIDISGSDFSGLKTLSSLFNISTYSERSALKTVNIKGTKFGKPTSISSMFSYTSVSEIDLSGIDLSEVTAMYDFASAVLATPSNIKGLTNMAALTDASNAFAYCSSFKDDLPTIEGAVKLSNISAIFNGCKNLETVNSTGNLGKWITSTVTNVSEMFQGCTSLTEAIFDNLDMSGVTGSTTNIKTGTGSMFESCTALKTVSFKNVNMSNVGFMGEMFRYCTSLESVDMSGIDCANCQSFSWWFGRKGYDSQFTKLTNVVWPANLGAHTSVTSIDVIYLNALTHDSCLDLFNKLANKTETATTSGTLTLNSTVKALMSDDEIKIATDKGWTIS